MFNALGTLKYKESPYSRVAVVISSKHEKRAVSRNKLRRRLYSLFSQNIKGSGVTVEYIFYTSKQAPRLEYNQIKALFNELLSKTTK